LPFLRNGVRDRRATEVMPQRSTLCRRAFEIAKPPGLSPHVIGDIRRQLGAQVGWVARCRLEGGPAAGKTDAPPRQILAATKREIGPHADPFDDVTQVGTPLVTGSCGHYYPLVT